MVPKSFKPALRALSLIRASTEGRVFAALDAVVQRTGRSNDPDVFARNKRLASATAALKATNKPGPFAALRRPSGLNEIQKAVWDSGAQGRAAVRRTLADPLSMAACNAVKDVLFKVPAGPLVDAATQADLIANFCKRRVSIPAPASLSALEKALWHADPFAAALLSARTKRVPGPALPAGVTPEKALESIAAELLRTMSRPS